MKVSKEQTYSFNEIAQELGISEEDLIMVAMKEGLIDENGMPTEYAIKEGLLGVEREIDFCDN